VLFPDRIQEPVPQTAFSHKLPETAAFRG